MSERFVIKPGTATYIAQARDVVAVYEHDSDWEGVPVSKRRRMRAHVAWHIAGLLRRTGGITRPVVAYIAIWEQARVSAEQGAPGDSATMALPIVQRWIEDMGVHPAVAAAHELS